MNRDAYAGMMKEKKSQLANTSALQALNLQAKIPFSGIGEKPEKVQRQHQSA